MVKGSKINVVYIAVIFSLLAMLFLLISCSKEKELQVKKYTIGIVNPNKVNKDITLGFIEGLAEHGFVETKNATFIIHEVPADLTEATNDLVARNVDLIFAFTTPAAKKAQKAVSGKNIPVVFAVYDPVKSKLINSLSLPGGNLTGIQIRGSAPKSLEWLLTLSPDTKKIFIPVKYDTRAAKQNLSDLKKTAKSLGVKIITAEVNTVQELDTVLSTIPEDIDALFLTRSIFIASNARKIVDEAIRRKLPVGSSTSMFKKGATITYGVESFHTGRQAGRLASLILQGNKPGIVPAEMSDYFLGVNLKTAQASGIEVPNEILVRADHIIR